MKHYTGAIFDMDGVLFDTERVYQQTWQEIAEDYGVTLAEGFTEAISGTNGDVMCRVLEKYYHVPDGAVVMDRCKQGVRDKLPRHVPLKPGAAEILEYLRGRGLRIAVASSSTRAQIESNLRLSGLNRFIDAVISENAMIRSNVLLGDIVTIPKPTVRENTAARLATEAPAEPGSTPTPNPMLTTLVFTTPEPTPAPKVYNTDGLALEAQNILLVRLADDTRDEQAIYAVDSDDLIYPASTLKMITALTVLDAADPDDSVRVGTEIYIPPLDCSRASLEYGMTLTVRELLEGLLLPSGADAAYALGVYCGRKLEGNDSLSYEDAIDTFVAAMNRKAAEIGAAHTTARNVVGLDDKEQRTTAEDILRIAKVFLANPVLSEICGLPTAKITSEEGKTISLKNTNKMLLANSGYYNGNVAGVKTGTTTRAGNCLVSVFTVQDEQYLCIVMNSSYYGKFTDTQKLFEVCAAAE